MQWLDNFWSIYSNLVLTIDPEGNSTSAIYEERDLIYRGFRGLATPPPLVLLAPTDPTNYDVRGGAPALSTTFRYDPNGNLIETVDSDNTDLSSGNNDSTLGPGDLAFNYSLPDITWTLKLKAEIVNPKSVNLQLQAMINMNANEPYKQCDITLVLNNAVSIEKLSASTFKLPSFDLYPHRNVTYSLDTKTMDYSVIREWNADTSKDEVSVGTMGSFISAIDYKTGKTVWKHKFRSAGNPRGAPGLLTTAGRLLFGGDVSGNFVAFDPANGKPLWHPQIGQVTNAPETYMVDGRQHMLIAAGDTLYSFALY